MAATIISRLKKTGQEILVKDRLGTEHAGRISWFDEHFFSIALSSGDEVVFANNSIASFTIPGGHEKRALNRSDTELGSEAEDADF